MTTESASHIVDGSYDSTCCSGDDDGLIKTWDQRQAESSGSFQAHTDFVSDMVLHEREQCLIAVSGDGMLTVNDLRTGKVQTLLLHWPLSAMQCSAYSHCLLSFTFMHCHFGHFTPPRI